MGRDQLSRPPAKRPPRNRKQLAGGERRAPVFGVINRRLALVTAISGVVITVVISLATFSFVRVKEIERVEQHVRIDLSSRLNGIAQSLWNYDAALVQGQLDGFSKLPTIERIKLRSTEGDEWTAGNLRTDHRASMSFDVARASGDSPEKLGELEVWLDLAAIDANIRELALVPLTVVAGTSVVTGVVVLLLFHQLIGRHLRHLAGFLAYARGDSRDQRFAFRRAKSRTTADELDRIEETLNRMLETERKLRHTEIELMAAMEHSGDGLALYDADDRLMFTNREYRRICAVVEDLLVVGATFEAVLRGHVERGAVRQARGREEEWIRWRLSQHRNPVEALELYLEVPGLWVRVKENKRPGGGVLMVLSDVTEYKRLTQELSRHKDHLEELVDERTRALDTIQDELLRAERLAAIGQLTGTVSHELRNPLGTIQSSFAIIRECIDTDEEVVARACERIDRNINRCVAIIDELLEYTRNRELAKRPVDIDDWLRSVVQEQDVPPCVVVRTSLHAGVELPIDKEKLRQAVVNVLQNAWQSMVEQNDSSSCSELYVSTGVVDDRVEIGVADTGPGMVPDIKDRIFEPLFSTRSFGVGLGLPLVKRVVEQHGGNIEVDSTPGDGTRMLIRLPLVVDGVIDGVVDRAGERAGETADTVQASK